jgi:hypothetical protein
VKTVANDRELNKIEKSMTGQGDWPVALTVTFQVIKFLFSSAGFPITFVLPRLKTATAVFNEL